uniref:Craniofacial development protein 1 n=1 Tax=Apteryx owenii TaxID=8824 RepID=A0A8B9PAY5_APTOW
PASPRTRRRGPGEEGRDSPRAGGNSGAWARPHAAAVAPEGGVRSPQSTPGPLPEVTPARGSAPLAGPFKGALARPLPPFSLLPALGGASRPRRRVPSRQGAPWAAPARQRRRRRRSRQRRGREHVGVGGVLVGGGRGLRALGKRKKGGLLLEPGEKEEEKAQQNNEEEEVDNLKQAERDREEEEKKKEDALWASFLSDVGQKPKVLTATQVTQTSKAEEKSVNKLQEKSKEPEKPKDAGKLTITEVFDFAGEEVRVTKEVDATSKEAKSFLKQQEKIQSGAPASLPTVSGVKRPSGMSSLLGKITSKKQKMSTLEKSKLDWENFKEEEGIGEELAIHNRGKDGKIRSFWIRDLILYFT